MNFFIALFMVVLVFGGCTSASKHRSAVQDESADRLTVGTVQREIHIGMSFFDPDGKQTDSGSSSEQIIKNRDGSFTLLFIHHNKGNYDDSTFNMHRGLTEIKYNTGEKSFNGFYFNDPHRKTHGELKFRKIS